MHREGFRAIGIAALFSGLALALLASPARSALLFTDRAQWENALGTAFIHAESFETATAPPVIVDGTLITLSNGLSILGQGGGGLGFLHAGWPPAFPTKHIETDFETTETKLVFQFESDVIAFGFDYAEADVDSSVWIDGVDSTPFGAPASPSSTTSAFVGVIADAPFSAFSIATDAFDQEYYVDDLAFVFVPEPSAAALVLCGLLGICVARKRHGRPGWTARTDLSVRNGATSSAVVVRTAGST